MMGNAESQVTEALYELRVFGELQLCRVADGMPLRDVGRKPLALLAVIAHAAPDSVSRERLCALLWPELESTKARHVLSQTLYALRRDLPGSKVVSGTQSLSLAPELFCDLARFRAAVVGDDARNVLAAVDGRFLDGVSLPGCDAFEQWVQQQRQTIELIRAGALQATERIATQPRVAQPAPPTDEHADTSAARPGWRRYIRVAALLTVAVGSVWGLSRASTVDEEIPPPISVWEDMKRERVAVHKERLAATDSSTIGRVLILPARNYSRKPEYDSVLPKLDYLLWELQSHEFAQPVSREESLRLDSVVANWRIPNSTRTQNAYMLKESGAALLVRPGVVARGDSAAVALYFARTFRRPEAEAEAEVVIENVSRYTPGMSEPGGHDGSRAASHMFVRFMRSMEQCDLDSHRTALASPWCWKERDELVVVPGATKAIWEALSVERAASQPHNRSTAR